VSGPIQLWVVAYEVNDAARSRRVREVLRFAGTRVRPCVYEVVATKQRLGRILMDMAEHLDSKKDRVRAYRVCALCREETWIFGEGELSRAPVAIII
jgi:CRISPR-associated protein Cas2